MQGNGIPEVLTCCVCFPAAGAQAIAAALPQARSLRKLYLGFNHISDEGALSVDIHLCPATSFVLVPQTCELAFCVHLTQS
jgi:hypothetical protein